MELAIAVAAAVAFDATIAASGSRGAIAAGFTGTLVAIVFARSPVRARVVATGVALALLAATIVVALAPKSKGEATPHAQPAAAVIAASGPPPKPGYENVEADHPFAFDIGTQEPGEAAPTPLAPPGGATWIRYAAIAAIVVVLILLYTHGYRR